VCSIRAVWVLPFVLCFCSSAAAGDIETCKAVKEAPDAAIEACSRLLTAQPFISVPAYTNRCAALYYLKGEDLDEALSDCDAALSIDPGTRLSLSRNDLVPAQQI
jgi:hypothetical protein